MPILRLSSRSSARLLGGEEGKGLFTDTDTDTVTDVSAARNLKRKKKKEKKKALPILNLSAQATRPSIPCALLCRLPKNKNTATSLTATC